MLYITWDPELGIKLGSFVLRYYSLMFVAAFLFGWFIIEYIFKQEKKDKKYLDPLFMYMFFGVLIGARIGHVLFYQPELIKEDFFSVFLPFQFNPEIRFTGFQGLASHGAIIGILFFLYLFIIKTKFNETFSWLLDRIIIPVALACALIRIGNFMNSEIVGKPFDGSWAVLFKQQSSEYGLQVPRHPSQLYESFGYFLTFLAISFLYFKTNLKNKTGNIFAIGLITILVIRMAVEITKEPQGEEIISAFGLNSGQILSIPPIVYCIYLLIKNNKTNA